MEVDGDPNPPVAGLPNNWFWPKGFALAGDDAPNPEKRVFVDYGRNYFVTYIPNVVFGAVAPNAGLFRLPNIFTAFYNLHHTNFFSYMQKFVYVERFYGINENLTE